MERFRMTEEYVVPLAQEEAWARHEAYRRAVEAEVQLALFQEAEEQGELFSPVHSPDHLWGGPARLPAGSTGLRKDRG